MSTTDSGAAGVGSGLRRSPSPEKGLFVRDATGLVRKISIRDAFSINMGSINIGAGWVALTFILAIFTNADLTISFLLAGVAAGLLAVVYVELVSAMPRSGGDYVFISRILHPALGSMVGVAELIIFAIFPAFWATNFATGNVEGFLSTLGTVTGNSAFTSAATNVASRGPEIVIALIFVAVFAALAIWNTKTAARVLVGLVVLQILALLVALGVMLLSSQSDFVQAFNAAYGPKETYSGMIALAQHIGYSSGFSLSSSISALPYAALAIWGFSWAAYPAGELRNATKNITYSQAAAIGISIVLYIAVWVLSKKALGETFLNAANYVATNYPAQYPIPDQPSLVLYTTMLTSNGFLKVIITLVPLFAEMAIVLTYLLTTSRIIFGLSFDRILPSRLASVNDRTATPIPAILLTMVTIMIVTIIAITTSFLSVWSNGTLDLAIIYTVLSVAGALMPFLKPNLYAASPKVIQGKIGGLPAITIVGALSALFSLYIVYLAFQQPLVVGPIGWQSVTATIGVFVLGLLVYFVARMYWRPRGIDPALAMVEIPPE